MNRKPLPRRRDPGHRATAARRAMPKDVPEAAAGRDAHDPAPKADADSIPESIRRMLEAAYT